MRPPPRPPSNPCRKSTALATATLLIAMSLGCRHETNQQLWLVEKQDFVHQIRAEGLLRAASTQKLTVPREAGQSLRLAWLADDGRPVKAGDIVARFDRGPIDRKRLAGEQDLQKATLESQKLERRDVVDTGSLKTTLTIATLDQAFSERFQKKDEQVFSRKVIAESSIDRELAEKRRSSAEAAIDTQKRLARTELELMEIAKRKAEAEIGNARQGLAALEVRAPHDGIFLRARLWRGEKLEPGGEMWPGSEVGELPKAEELQAEVYVLEADAGGLAQGQKAEVRIEAAPDRVFAAKITRLDASARPRFRGSPVQYFAVTLAFDDPRAVVGKLGQQVTARLTVNERQQVLVVPRQAVEQSDGKARVQVLRGGQKTPVDVVLGPASAGQVVIDSGLEAGDRVFLPSGKTSSPANASGPSTTGPSGARR